MLTVKTNSRLGFADEEREIDRGDMLKLKTNGKLGFGSEERKTEVSC